MKKYNWLLVLLILACLGGLYSYRMMERMRTDTTPPEITINIQNPEFSVQDDKAQLTEGLTATDSRDGDVTDSLVVESITLLGPDGSISVKYAAFDKAGNAAKITREAKFTDYVSPKFTLNGPLLYPQGRNFDVLSTVGATDALDGDIQHRVRATMVEDTSIANLGTHLVQFQVTNSLGDTVKQSFPVEVYAAEDYSASLTLTSYLVYLPKGTTFRAENYLNEFTLMGEETVLRNGLPEDYTMKNKGSVDTSQPGTYTVEYRVTYTDRHEVNPEYDRDYTAYSKLIVIVEG